MITQDALDIYSSYLKKNKYKNIIQELKLEECTDDIGEYIQLNLIKIKKSQRNKGWGSAIMYDICDLADNNNVRVRLLATDVYLAELKRLYGFYGKHGFVLIKNDLQNEMLYYPKKKKIKL